MQSTPVHAKPCVAIRWMDGGMEYGFGGNGDWEKPFVTCSGRLASLLPGAPLLRGMRERIGGAMCDIHVPHPLVEPWPSVLAS